jgi:hypothetical protein
MKGLQKLTVSTLVAALALTPTFGLAADKAAKAETKTEKVVSLDQVPPAVKATMDKEAKKGETPVAVTMETEKGKTFYEVEFTKDNKARYVHIAQDGKVLKRESAKKEMKEESKAEGKK